MNNQYRNAPYGELNDYYSVEPCAGYYLDENYNPSAPPSVAVATERSLVLQVPDADQGKCPALKPNPATGLLNTVNYEFGEKEVNTEELFN